MRRASEGLGVDLREDVVEQGARRRGTQQVGQHVYPAVGLAPRSRAVISWPRVDLYDELRALVRALDDARVEYALCGGLALAVYGVPRATRDIDLLARPADLDQIRAVARARGFLFEALPMTFSSSGLSIQRFSKLEGSDPLMLDVLLVEEALEAVWMSRTRVAYEDGDICVVSRRALITLKLSAGRPQDLVDVQNLEALEDD